jgi:hypothetical protein
MRALSFFALLLAATAVRASGATDDTGRELLKPPTVEVPSPITDRFALTGVYQFRQVSTQLRYDPSAVLRGTDFSAESLLGLPSRSDTGSIGLMFRFADRSRISIDYLKLTRHGDVVLNQSLVVGTSTYQVSDRLLTDVDLRMLGLAYTYSFLKTESVEIGGGLGVRLGQAQGSGEVSARGIRDTFDGVALLPTLTVDGSWRFTQRFSFNGRVQYLAVHVSGVDGSFSSLHGDVQFRASRNLAFGAGYSSLHALASSSEPRSSGRLDFQAKGPELFLRASF